VEENILDIVMADADPSPAEDEALDLFSDLNPTPAEVHQEPATFTDSSRSKSDEDAPGQPDTPGQLDTLAVPDTHAPSLAAPDIQIQTSSQEVRAVEDMIED
jgi:hypothetical protein